MVMTNSAGHVDLASSAVPLSGHLPFSSSLMLESFPGPPFSLQAIFQVNPTAMRSLTQSGSVYLLTASFC